jgi:hypothetical protein
VAGDARRHRPVVLVHDLDHDQVLEDVHAGLALAGGRDDGRLGGAVEVQRLQPPGLGHAPAHVGGLHLRGGGDQGGRDPQPALELLLGQGGGHGRVGGQGLGREGVEGVHHLGQGGGHGQPGGGAGLAGQQHGVQLVGDVQRAGRADPGQPGPRPQAPAGQAPQAGAEPDRELVQVVHEQAAQAGGPGGGEQRAGPGTRARRRRRGRSAPAAARPGRRAAGRATTGPWPAARRPAPAAAPPGSKGWRSRWCGHGCLPSAGPSFPGRALIRPVA